MISILITSIAVALANNPDNIAQQSTTIAISAAPQRVNTIDRIFLYWLSAFNSADPAIIKAFYGKYRDDPDPVFEIEDSQDSCGLTVDRIVERSSTAITVLLRERCLPGVQRVTIELATPDGAKIKTLRIAPLMLPGDEATTAVADIANRLAKRDAFAGSLIIVRNNKTLLARSWGLADPAMKIPMTRDTPMFLASAGKMFTAVAVLQLVEAGKIDLDAPLGRYLKDYPNREMARVNIRQLLTHRGGTGDIGILGREDGANRAKVRTIVSVRPDTRCDGGVHRG
jgi:D-alanyl-D-alanine carboxypeptidase